MGFGMYGKANRNKRETSRNGVKFEDTARDVYREIHGKSNRAVCLQPNGIYDTNGTIAGIQGGKIARCTTKSGISVRVFPIFPEE